MQHRRNFLHRSACGFGGLAFAGMLSRTSNGGTQSGVQGLDGLHHRARAKRVIFLFMQGGVSQVDSFDYKPILAERDGQMVDFTDPREFANTRKTSSAQRLMKSPWEFRQYGQCGRWVSDLFPQMARHVDKMTFIHSMHTEGVAHGPATLFLHCGSQNTIRPSMGSWTVYGLGSENENLPSFISIAPSIGNGGPRNYGSAFLPARYQGTAIGGADRADLTIENLPLPSKLGPDTERLWQNQQSLNQLQRRQFASQHIDADLDEVDSVVESFELAARMQTVAPSILNFSDESAETLELYGIGKKETDVYGRRCLLARRLCEAGVRYIQVNYGDNSANPAWDQHSNLPKHKDHATAVDLPISGLLEDLGRRGLLEDTIVWWGGEFGRAPYAEKNGTGRDHNPSGFTVWLAGGGFTPGVAYGATDTFGQNAIENKVHMHDLHATILHQLGIDHERLTFRVAGRDYRLTDIHGKVVRAIVPSVA